MFLPPNNKKDLLSKDIKDFLISLFFISIFISPLIFIIPTSIRTIKSYIKKTDLKSVKENDKELIVKKISEKYSIKLKVGFLESKCTRNKRIAKEVIKKKLENNNPYLDYEEYMESIKGLKFYYDQKYKDSLFRQLTRMIFISECGYHDEICNIRYCPPH